MTVRDSAHIAVVVCAGQMFFVLTAGTLSAARAQPQTPQAPHEVSCEAKLNGIQALANRFETDLRKRDDELATCRRPPADQVQNAAALRTLEGSVDDLLVRIQQHLERLGANKP